MPIDVTCISLGQALFVNIPGEPMAITAGRLRELVHVLMRCLRLVIRMG